MSAGTAIEWCDHTFNPWWGCTKVSPGCARCYAEAFARRVGHAIWGDRAPRRFFGDAHWEDPRRWASRALAEKRRFRVFCASMADVFEDRRDLDYERHRLWLLINETPELDWLLLTKRIENVRRMLPELWRVPPRPNVWLGATVEDQDRAADRIVELLRTPAALRWVSYEPALELVDFERLRVASARGPGARDRLNALTGALVSGATGRVIERLPALDWIVCGGESGPGARPCDVAWLRRTLERCRENGVPCFVKQLGARRILSGGDGVYTAHPTLSRIREAKGADPAEWPADLRVREWPATPATEGRRSMYA
jgi:protein gp37